MPGEELLYSFVRVQENVNREIESEVRNYPNGNTLYFKKAGPIDRWEIIDLHDNNGKLLERKLYKKNWLLDFRSFVDSESFVLVMKKVRDNEYALIERKTGDTIAY